MQEVRVQKTAKDKKAPSVHLAKEGDRRYKLQTKYGVSIATLTRLNPEITDWTDLVGKRIWITEHE